MTRRKLGELCPKVLHEKWRRMMATKISLSPGLADFSVYDVFSGLGLNRAGKLPSLRDRSSLA